MGVCTSDNNSKSKRYNQRSNIGQQQQLQNDKNIQITSPTDNNIKQNNQNDQNAFPEEPKSLDADKVIKNKEPSLNQLLTMSFDKNNPNTKFKEEEDKNSDKYKITNLSQGNKCDDYLYSFIEINVGSYNVYSTENDWNHAIKLCKKITDVQLANKLLSLNERRWNKENIAISESIKSARGNSNSAILNKYLNSRIKLQEHYNWVIWALSVYYQRALLELTKGDFHTYSLELPNVDSMDWINGFEWKGIYVRIIDESHNFKLKAEIKAMNYLFFEFIQILDCVQVSEQNNSKLLSNELIFPLISYSKFNGLYLMGSVCIPKLQIDQNDSINHNLNNQRNGGMIFKPSQIKETMINNNATSNDNFIKDRDSISHIDNDNNSNHLLNDSHLFNKHIDFSKFSLEDLDHSHLFRNINETNLIKIIDNFDVQNHTPKHASSKEKYILINATSLIPNLYYSTIKAEVMVIEESKEIKYERLKDPKKSMNELLKAHLSISQKNKYQYDHDMYGISYKVFANNKGNTNMANKPVNWFYIKNHLNQIGNLAERLKPDSLNKLPWFKKAFINAKNISIENKALVQYSLNKDIKLKYSLITQHKGTIKCGKILYDKEYHKRVKFTSHIDHFAKVINQSQGIVDYNQIRQLFERFGINKIFEVFILAKITNNNIADLIKIDILTSIIAKYINFEEGANIIAKLSIISYDHSRPDQILAESGSNLIKGKHMAAIRISKIFTMIMTILNISSIPVSYAKKVIEQITFSLFMLSLKWRLLDDEFNFNIFTSKYYDDTFSLFRNFSPDKMLNEIITVARTKPFQFISSLERKLQFSIDPTIKLFASINLDNFVKEFNKSTILLNDPIVKAYINPIELTYYILAKSIVTTDSGSAYEPEKEQIPLNRLLFSNNQGSVNQSKLSQEGFDSSYQEDKPNVTLDKLSKNYVYKLKPNNITKINDKNNKFIELTPGFQDIDFDSKSYITDFRGKTKGEDKINLNLNRGKFWDSICRIFQFNFPPLLYKLLYVYNENIKDTKTIYKYLDSSYKVKRIEAIKDWKNNAEIVLNEIYSVNTGESTLLHVYLYLFLHYLFVVVDVKSAKELFTKMKEKMEHTPSYSLNWLIIMNYIEGLITETTSFIESEEFYSKTIIFTLFLFGDPRGRNNYGHYVTLFPLWKVGRQTCILDNTLTNETLRELFYCQDFCFRSLLSPLKSFKQNNFFISSLKYVSLAPQNVPKFPITPKEGNKICENGDDSDCDCNDDLLERPSLVPDIDEILKDFVLSERNFDLCSISDVSYFIFPSISDTKCSYINHFFSELFFSFLLKGFSAIIFQRDHNPYNEDYLTKLGLNCYSESSQTMTIESISSKVNLHSNGTAYNAYNRKSKGNKNILSPYLYEILLKRLDFKLYPPNGTIVSWGNNSHNETSHDNYDCLFFPRIVYKLKDQIITKLSAGWEHSIVISNERKCFSWGNNQHGQCGVGQSHNVLNPTMIKGLINIKEVSCGNEHSLAINYEGNLFAWGNSEDGVLGFKSNSTEYTPVKIKNMNEIQQITCGTIHNLALNREGQVFSWGCTKGGQLGLSEDYLLSIKDFNGFIYEPTIVKSITNEKIISVSSGEAHSIALASSGKIYTWGFGSNGQLGLGFCEDSFEPGLGLAKSRRLVPIPVPIDEKISHIQCGKTFSMLITDKKELYAYGVNDLNQLGLNDEPPMNHLYNQIDVFNNKCSDYVIPTKLEIFINMQVLKIACGESHCLAIVNDLSNQVKTLWSWGSNRFGQLGQSNQNRKSTPKPVNYFLSYRNSEIEDIACGGFHSLCLLKRKEEHIFDNDTATLKRIIHNSMKHWN